MAELDLTKLSMDPAAQELIKKAQADGVETIWDRAAAMKPCPFGIEGACCRICAQGPCRVPMPKKKEGETTAEKKQRMGLCGATAETTVARNFARMVAAGTAAHSDHARGVAKLFIEVANGRTQGYQLKDVAKLKRVAKDWGVAITERAASGEISIKEFRAKLNSAMGLLGVDKSFTSRYVNEGFSGGEKKRLEILQMFMLEPEFSILDETDSGLDLDALRVVANGVNSLRGPERAIVLVTHYQRLLDYIEPDYVHVLSDGQILKSGDRTLALELEKRGYDWVREEARVA